MPCVSYRWIPGDEEQKASLLAALRSNRTRLEAAKALGRGVGALDRGCQVHGIKTGAELGAGLRREFAASVLEPSTVKAVPETPPVIYVPPPPPVIPVGREVTVGLAGDLHDPERNEPAWAAFLRWCADVQPDVLVLNEMLEFLSASQHNGGAWGARWKDDKERGRRLFAKIRSVNPRAEIVLLESNHDTRLERLLLRNAPQLDGDDDLTIPAALRLADAGIRWVPEEQVFRIGRLKVIHGHQLSSNPEKGMLPENACKRAIQRFGEPGWTVVFFHTHRKGYWAEKHDSGMFEAVNLACLRTLRPAWHRGWVAGHSNGFGVAHIGTAGQTNLYPVDIENGSFVYGARRYAA